MNFQISSAKITSPTTDSNWGGCFVEGDLVVLLEIETDGKILASHLGKSVFDALLLKYNRINTKDKIALKSLLSEISQNSNIKTAIICLIDQSNIYLGCLGKGQVVLGRDNETGTIVSGGFTSSGQIALNDRLMFHSDTLAKVLNTDELEKLYKTRKLDEFEEELASKLSTEKKAPGLSVLSLHIGEKNIEVKDNIKPDAPKNLILEYFSKKTKRQKIFIGVFSALIVIFVVNLFAGIIKSGNSQKEKLINDSLTIVESQYDEAQGLIGLNPVRARELLSSGKLTVSQLISKTKKNSKEYKILKDTFDKISVLEVSAYQIYKLTAVPLFFDVSLIKSGAKADFMTSYLEKKVILDKENKIVYFLDTQTKHSEIIAGENNVKNITLVTTHGNFAYALGDEGIFSIDLSKKTSEKVIDPSDKWGDIKSLTAFGGNLYLLDGKNNTIWKYIATDNGFSQIINYVNSGIPVNLSDSDNLTIDGSVYVAAGSSIIKLTSGNLDKFSFQDFSDTITNIDSLSTSDTEKYIYILDKTLKRIIVFDKDGLYHSQYQWDDLKNAKSLVTSEKEGKIFVLIGSKIYALDIK